eukprot:gene17021-20238_t
MGPVPSDDPVAEDGYLDDYYQALGHEMIPTSYCGVGDKGFDCPKEMNSTCQYIENPSLGYIHFDNIGAVTLLNLKVVTLDGWAVESVSLQDAEYSVVVVYFIVVIVFLSFLVINLFVAVITSVFEKVRMEQNRSGFQASEDDLIQEDEPVAYKRRRGVRIDPERIEKVAAQVEDRKLKGITRFVDSFKGLLQGSGREREGANDTAAVEMVETRSDVELMRKDTTDRISSAMLRNFFNMKTESNSTKYQKFTREVARVISDEWFDTFITGSIFMNTFCLALVYHEMSDGYAEGLEVLEFVFLFIFTTEMLLKMIGLGGMYFHSGGNLFDMCIVIPSLLEFIMDLSMPPDRDVKLPQVSLLRFLRLFRVARVARLLKDYEMVYRLMMAIFGNYVAISNLIFFLVFVINVFSIMGLQLFQGKWEHLDGLDDRVCFDNIGTAFLTLLQVLTGDRWTTIMLKEGQKRNQGKNCETLSSVDWRSNGMEGADNSVERGIVVIFFVGFYLFANAILLNLFIAVVLENFQISEAEKRSRQHKEEQSVRNQQHETERINPLTKLLVGRWKVLKSFVKDLRLILKDNSQGYAEKTWLSRMEGLGHTCAPPKDNEELTCNMKRSDTLIVPYPPAHNFLNNSAIHRFHLGYVLARHAAEGAVLLGNAPLQITRFIVAHPFFDRTVMLTIIVSSGCLTLEKPDMAEETREILDLLDHVFFGIFSAEFLLKVSARGLLFSDDAYLMNSWDRLDLCVLLISLSNYIPGNGQNAWAKVLRIGRVARPLRVINRNEGMKALINCLIECIPNFFSVLAMTIVVYMLFGILGVHIFMGRSQSCNDLTVANQVDAHVAAYEAPACGP